MLTAVQTVKACRTPQEALLALAAHVDALLAQQPADPWQQPLNWVQEAVDAVPGPPLLPFDDGRARIEGDDVIVAPVSEERQQERYDFACDARLDEFYGPGLDQPDFLEAYVKGGPRWLYYTNRDCVMQMPVSIREKLVADVLLDSPSEAAEIGADILKYSFDEAAREGEQIEQQRLNRELGESA